MIRKKIAIAFVLLFLVLFNVACILTTPKTITPKLTSEVTTDAKALPDEIQVTQPPQSTAIDFPRPPSTVRIVFAATGWTVPGSGEEIFVMNTDGTDTTAISNSRGDDRDPAWSPDGKSIVFTSDRDGNAEIYLMNADGSNQTRLTNTPENEFHPRWSPDGKRIIFSRTFEDNSSDLFVINLDGSEFARLTNSSEIHEEYPDWSPDGKTILFSAFGGGQSGIYTMDAVGTIIHLLMSGPLHFARWSPDGTYIAFDGEPKGCNFEIYVMKSDGTELRQITDHPEGCGGYNKGPSWSPDGNRLVYYSSKRSSSSATDVFTINIDGSDEKALTFGKTDLYNGGFNPDWSPIP